MQILTCFCFLHSLFKICSRFLKSLSCFKAVHKLCIITLCLVLLFVFTSVFLRYERQKLFNYMEENEVKFKQLKKYLNNKNQETRKQLLNVISTSKGFNSWCAKHQRHNRSYTNSSDKYWAKSYIKSKMPNLKIASEYAWVANANDINDKILGELPSSYMMKPNHLTGSVVLVNGKEIKCHRCPCLKKTVKWCTNVFSPNTLMARTDILKSICRKWLTTRVRSHYPIELREEYYDGISRKCIFEEFLGKTSFPEDYKVFTFHGKPFLIRTDIGRYHADHQTRYYTPKWKPINVTKNVPKQRPEQAPIFLEKMLEMAAVLAKPFLMIRVDFFAFKGTIAFAEFSPSPSNCFISPTGFPVDLFYGYIAEHKHTNIDPEDILLLQT